MKKRGTTTALIASIILMFSVGMLAGGCAPKSAKSDEAMAMTQKAEEAATKAENAAMEANKAAERAEMAAQKAAMMAEKSNRIFTKKMKK